MCCLGAFAYPSFFSPSPPCTPKTHKYKTIKSFCPFINGYSVSTHPTILSQCLPSQSLSTSSTPHIPKSRDLPTSAFDLGIELDDEKSTHAKFDIPIRNAIDTEIRGGSGVEVTKSECEYEWTDDHGQRQ